MEKFFVEETDGIQPALDWFLSFIGPEDWIKRKQAIEKKIAFEYDNPMFKGKTKDSMVPLTDKEDQIGWYLYLAEKSLTDPPQYEVIQGARVMPIFQRIGTDLEYLSKIEGLKKKVRFLVKKGRASADSILFEILVALLWTKNGWKVSIIPENPPAKTPDLLAEMDGEKWFIECKRLNKTSDYSERERAKLLKMLSYISAVLLKYHVLLDITFHSELEQLPDDFLERELSAKIPLITNRMNVISNDTWEVNIDFVDYGKINDHLKNWVVKYPSPQLYYLIAGKKIDPAGFSSGIKASFQHHGKGTGNGQYVDQIAQAYGVSWKCDAQKSIDKKARDIKNHIIDACKQLPDYENAAIHVGLETLDGIAVEDHRHNKIYNTINFFDKKNTGIKWIYCHFFQSYAPPESLTWVFDETISYFSDNPHQKNGPLDNRYVILPPGAKDSDDVHWHKPTP
ncbi:hypothetical protein [Chitinophaga sp. ARDCPP14]|uniref:hypothetical protein n=1 Tax=Chitinophaga sp. ARDCPP14 TaxID=3391139 RepID=UPI003F5201D1